MRTVAYDAQKAVHYGERWALGRNPLYYNFDALGGDCTNFISQCVYAGSGVMNPDPEGGWYYEGLNKRSPSWTSVAYFFRFLISNRGSGPFGETAGRGRARRGDVIQLGNEDGVFYHSLLILSVGEREIYVAAHSQDALWRPLSSYDYALIRYLHILGVRIP